MNTTEKIKESCWDKLKLFLQELWNEFPTFFIENSIIISLLLLYIFFYRFWENLIGDHIIDKFLFSFEPTLLCDSIFIGISIISILLILKNWGKNITRKTKFLCFIALAFWIYYSCFNVRLGLEDQKHHSYYLYFEHLKIIEQIRYVDIIPIITICTLFYSIYRFIKKVWCSIIFIWNRIFKKERNENINVELDKTDNNLFELDAPIHCDEDVLGRNQIAASAMDSLLDIKTSDGCFTFGISAPWGSGKSSFLNMMKDRINSISEEKNKSIRDRYKNITVIDFNPWLYSVDKDLVTAFFDELSKSLERYDQSLAKNVIDYSRLLSSFKTDETAVIASIIDLVQQDSAIQDKKKQIVKILKRIKRKIIVFIDDLDRLDTNEILEMLKLLRNASDFPNMYFVAAYDKEYLVSCLSKKIPHKTTEYVEKIFQMEFPLLESTQNDIRNKLIVLLKELSVAEVEQKKCLDQFIRWTDELAFRHIITTFRDVKRFVNCFQFSYKNLKDAVNIRDLLMIELIKTKFPAVFNYFAKHREFVLISSGPDDPFWRLIEPNEFNEPNEFYRYEALYHSFFTAIVEQKNELNITDTDISFIKVIFNILFPIKQTQGHAYSISRGISDKNYTENYFVHNSFSSEIPQNDFDRVILSEDVNHIKDTIIRWSSKKVSLRNRLNQFQPNNKDDLKKLIELLLYIKSFNIDNVITNNEITDRIRDICKFNLSKKYEQEDKEFIKQELMKYGYNKGICLYLYSLVYEEEKWDYPLEINDINNVRVELFKKCLQNDGISARDVIACSVHTLNTKIENGLYVYELIPDIKKLLRSFIENNLRDFIPFMIIDLSAVFTDKEKIEKGITKGLYRLNGNLTYKLWENLNEFYQFIEKSEVDSDGIIAEFKKFINEYKECNQNDDPIKPIKFGFECIKPFADKK